MTRLVTWPFLIGGPGDGKPLPRQHGNAAIYEAEGQNPFVYAERVIALTNYRQTEPAFIEARCYVYSPEAIDSKYECLKAMARYALERLP